MFGVCKKKNFSSTFLFCHICLPIFVSSVKDRCDKRLLRSASTHLLLVELGGQCNAQFVPWPMVISSRGRTHLGSLQDRTLG